MVAVMMMVMQLVVEAAVLATLPDKKPMSGALNYLSLVMVAVIPIIFIMIILFSVQDSLRLCLSSQEVGQIRVGFEALTS